MPRELNLNQYVSHDETYRISFEQDKIERSNLEANIAFVENTGLLSSEKRTLEIGCGAGSLTNYFRERGYDISAIDISRVALEKAVELYEGLPVYQMAAEKLAFQDDSFDIVLSFDVLEHIPSVDGHLREARRVLRAGGYYLFGTPNKYTNIPFGLLKNKRLNYRTYHPSLQTCSSLKRLMEKHGFEIEIIKQPIFNKFTEEKVREVFWDFLAKAIAAVPWPRIPLTFYPSFYVIAKARK